LDEYDENIPVRTDTFADSEFDERSIFDRSDESSLMDTLPLLEILA